MLTINTTNTHVQRNTITIKNEKNEKTKQFDFLGKIWGRGSFGQSQGTSMRSVPQHAHDTRLKLIPFAIGKPSCRRCFFQLLLAMCTERPFQSVLPYAHDIRLDPIPLGIGNPLAIDASPCRSRHVHKLTLPKCSAVCP